MDIMELLAGRRTYRRFLQKPVPAGVVADMVEAVRLSSCGAQPAGHPPGGGPEPRDGGQGPAPGQWAAYLPPEQGVPSPVNSPSCSWPWSRMPPSPGDKDTDAGIALANLTLAAWAKGVGSCIMGAIDRPRLTELLGLSENEKLHSMVALGYPAHASRVVPLTEATGVKYYLDENRDYCVPKRAAADIARFV